MRILVISDSIPYPMVSGAPLRICNLLCRIARQHQVWLAAPLGTPEGAESVSHVQEFCYRVETANLRRRHPLMHLPGLLRYALAGKPLELRFHYSQQLAHKIQHLASSVDFDIVQIEHSHMALYLEALPPDLHCRTILMFHDIVFSKYARIFRFECRLGSKLRALLYSRMMRRWEPRYAERFGRCITVSEADRRLLLEANPRVGVDVVPNGVDTKVYQPLSLDGASPSLLFIGNMSYSANVDAAMFFSREILPLIRRMTPDVELWIVGKDPPAEVRQLSGETVHVTGRVDSVVPCYSRSTVCVVPLRAGGGTRIKILEAMALGRPVVSTSIGCEGLDVIDYEHLLIADSPEQFAEKTVRLLTDKPLHQRLATNARQLVVTRYDWDAIARQLMQIYAEVAD
jgi:sugar transferase (PEP-CTERM/EpsH1 system associated)